MEHLIANLASNIRRETIDGREYVVAPVTLIVPGVLNGSNGPLLYELNDITATADAWNGMPIVAPTHPIENGKQISARHPKVLAKWAIGNVFNVEVNGKLQAEAWFDVAKANKVDARAIPSIINGQKLEVSTGLAVDQEPTSGLTKNGTQYTAIARKYRPDHLALLLDSKGACSVNDGCGINNEEDKPVHDNIVVKGTELAGDGLIGTGGRCGCVLDISSSTVANPASADTGVAKEIKTSIVNHQKEPDMAKNATIDEQKKELVDDLVTNCSCYSEEDRETLNAMDLAMLAKCKKMMDENKATANKLKEQELVVNAAKKGFQAGNEEFTLNDKGEWVKREKTTTNSGGNQPTKKKIQTMEEFMETAPPEVVSAYNQMSTFVANQKSELIEQILESKYNVFTDEQLQSYELDDTEVSGKLVPGLKSIANRLAAHAVEPSVRIPSYVGAGAGSIANQRRTNTPEPLGLPEDAWRKVYDDHRVENKKREVFNKAAS